MASPDLGSSDVIETDPEGLQNVVRELQDSDATFVVVGGGKTGCDCIAFLAKNLTKRETRSPTRK